MAYSFPYSIVALTSGSGVPSNATPIHARDFNRLFQEVTAIEAALGPNPQGNKADVKTRLATALNDDGSYKKELLCEDDPSGNKRGCGRYLYLISESLTFDLDLPRTGYTEGFRRHSYTAFPNPPVFFWNVVSAAYDVKYDRMQLKAISPIGAVIDTRDNDATPFGSTHSIVTTSIAISSELEVYEEDVPWGLPPVRTG